MNRVNQILSTLGLILLAAGIVIYIISSTLWIYALIPGAVGLLLLAYWTFLNMEKVKVFLSQPSTIYRGNAFLIATLVLLILGFLNAILYRHYKRWDLTKEKIFTLSDSTVKELRHLDELVEAELKKGAKNPFEVVAFVNFDSPRKEEVADLFEEYAYYSKHFKYTLVDPDKNPVLAEKYKVKSYDVAVVKFGNKSVHVRDINENNLTNGIIKATRKESVTVCFVTGHGEADISGTDQKRSLSSARSALEAQGFKVKSIQLASFSKVEKLKEECKVLVIAGPKAPFYPPEVKLLSEYLNRSGKALIMLDPGYNVGIEPILERWGIVVENSYVVDLNALQQILGSGPFVPLGMAYDRFHDITKGFQYMTFFPLARSLKKTEKVPPKVTVTELVKTGSDSWAEFSFIEEIKKGKAPKFTSGTDRRGPITIAMSAEGTSTGTEGAGEEKTRLVSFGDSDFALDQYFAAISQDKQSIQPNGDLFLNAVNWLAEQKDLISIRAPQRETARIVMTATAQRTIRVITQFVFPLFIAAVGLVVFLRKRYM